VTQLFWKSAFATPTLVSGEFQTYAKTIEPMGSARLGVRSEFLPKVTKWLEPTCVFRRLRNALPTSTFLSNMAPT
jgi:hypothetical protein